MAKASKTSFVCSECGATTVKWMGQCPRCREWNTLEEAAPAAAPGQLPALAPTMAATPIAEVPAEVARAWPTSVSELDRVLGSGIVPGAVVLLAGEPGVGKSTLLLDVAAKAARASAAGAGRAGGAGSKARPVLYITGEESASQVRLRADRIGAVEENLLLAAENDLAVILGHIEQVNPSLVVVDSVQTITDSSQDGAAGGTSQVKAVASALTRVAKATGIPVIVIGHVTKDGSIAGPRVLEHVVDVVLYFEGEQASRLRLLRAVKNRFGPTDEVGCFDMDDGGITSLADPSGLFLTSAVGDGSGAGSGAGGPQPVPGTCVTVTLDGRRPMPIQIQALVADSALPSPRRAVSGLDSPRTSMTLAVLQARLGLPLAGQDIYVSTVGGARIKEPAGDLAVALAVASSMMDQALSPTLIAIGEVGLTGEIRPATAVARRLAEAERLGFTHAIVPAGSTLGRTGLSVAEVGTVREAIRLARAMAPSGEAG